MKNKYQTLVNQQIPISKALGWEIITLSEYKIITGTQLQPNINVHQTAFAGSIYAAAMATGWTLLKCWYDQNEFQADLVAAEATIKYLKPVTGDFECLAVIDKKDDNFQKLVSRLSIYKSCGFVQNIEIKCNQQICAILTVNFVFKC